MFTFLPPVNLFFILADVLQIAIILIIIEVVRSILNSMGVKNTGSYLPWARAIQRIVNPILQPFRKLWDSLVTGMTRNSRSSSYAMRRIDLSPMLAIITIEIVQNFLFKLGVQSLVVR